MAGFGLVPDDIVAAERPAEAVRGADIICTATTSMTPVFPDRDIAPGVHINGIGSYMPNMQEIPQETVLRATVVVDGRAAALAEAGDLIVPIRDGRMTAEKIHADLGEDAAERDHPLQIGRDRRPGCRRSAPGGPVRPGAGARAARLLVTPGLLRYGKVNGLSA